MNGINSLSRKETFTGSMVLFIGLFNFWPLAASLAHSGPVFLHGTLPSVLLNMLLPIILYLAGSILFFRQHNSGWILCATSLLQLIPVTFRYVLMIIWSGGYYAYVAMTIIFFVLLLMA